MKQLASYHSLLLFSDFYKHGLVISRGSASSMDAGIRTLDLILICYTVVYFASMRMYLCSMLIYFWLVLCFEKSVPT